MFPRRIPIQLLPLLAACLLAGGARAQAPPPQPASAAAPATAARLPPDATTRHTLDLPDRTLRFTATAGSVTLATAQGTPQAAIAYIAYQLEGADPQTRPVTFAINGGPGAASTWLHLGLLGPWRMKMDAQAAAPSAPAVAEPNALTWLDFTDLVFIDPVGTGYSRFLAGGEDVRKRLWSIRGDIDSLAETIRRWLDQNRRLASPKFLVGESYSGFRGPRLVRALSSAQGVGISGLVLVSPVLDFGGRSTAFDPVAWATYLPTMAAAMRAKQGPVTRESLADVEAYAASDYLVDLVRGERDPAAIERRVARVAALTGLDPELVRRRHSHVTSYEFLRERNRDTERVGSSYDATVTMPNPFPLSVESTYPEPTTDALAAPFTSAMLDIYARRLNWQPDGQYELANGTANRQWDWGAGRVRPEAVSALRTALALDPRLHVLVAHGLFDLTAPYFATKMLLDQIPLSTGADRIQFVVYPGGHMFYSRDDSRAAFRGAAAPLYAPR
ncbi:S10 family peptidase [Limobrevibacterium gyesilva]|uniref:Peptidase S10 n=1 Tax=Limobrevibacterium gyesilva TaxID=2991712 RepID=A0AA42CFT2_9PROT|nr:peptidase S10 [Limobrevibacterium gyesilva]MCW3477453.1 peptidase S10 [Limobrevibacterium gyesilva]